VLLAAGQLPALIADLLCALRSMGCLAFHWVSSTVHARACCAECGSTSTGGGCACSREASDSVFSDSQLQQLAEIAATPCGYVPAVVAALVWCCSGYCMVADAGGLVSGGGVGACVARVLLAVMISRQKQQQQQQLLLLICCWRLLRLCCLPVCMG
jgi:hypothetical protein